MLDWIPRDIPPLAQLPSIVLTELNFEMLSAYWSDAPTLPFHVRFCIAAILAWVFAAGNSSSAHGFSLWLQRLPPFQKVLDALRPLQYTGFTYQPYLESLTYLTFAPIRKTPFSRRWPVSVHLS